MASMILTLATIKRLSFSPLSQWTLLVAAAVLLVLLAVYVYGRTRPALDRRRRRLLIGLRACAFLCAILTLLQPALTLESRESRRPRVFVLVDGSASMRLPYDAARRDGSGTTRADVALEVARSLLKKLPGRFEGRLFVFSDSLRQLEKGPGRVLPEVPGERTAIGLALEEASSRVGNAPGAIVLISDGAASFGPDASRAARRISLPVYTVASAAEGSIRDIEISDILCSPTGYAGAETPVLVRVRGHGLENLSVPVSIFEGETVVARGMLRLAGPAESEHLLSVKPISAGTHFYRVTVPVVAGEASSINNSAHFSVSAVSEKLKIFYLEGELTWDFTFLKRELESDSRLRTTFALVSDWKAGLPATNGLVSLSPGVGPRLDRNTIVLIGDGAASHIDAGTWRILKEFVRSGGGLFLIGAEGLDRVPASARELLPAQVRRPDRWGARQYLSIALTPAGLNHPISRIAEVPASDQQAWREISPLLGAHFLENPKPDASVLFSATEGSAEFPVVVAGSYGRGRVLLVAASGLWRWAFTLAGVGGSETLFGRFISNAVSWLSETGRGDGIEVRPESPVFKAGETVSFTASGVRDVENLKVEAIDAQGRVIASVFAEGAARDTVTLGVGVLAPGRYRYRASRSGDGNPTITEGVFLVDTMGPEFKNLAPDSGLLSYISQASGGKFFRAEEVNRLAAEIQTFGKKTMVERQIQLWNHPALLVLFALALAAEWWFRRRWGLP